MDIRKMVGGDGYRGVGYNHRNLNPARCSPLSWLAYNKHFIRLVAIIIGLILTSPVYIIAAPQIEVKFFPVIKISHVGNSVIRANRAVCWDTEFEKLRDLAPRLFDYKIEFLDTVYSVNAYRLDPDGERRYLSTAGFANHEVGTKWISHYCFNIVETNPKIKPTDSFEVSGEAYYKSRFWVIHQPLPSFTVPALDKRPQP